MTFRFSPRWLAAVGLLCLWPRATPAATPREAIAQAIIIEDADEQAAAIKKLVGESDPAMESLFNAWNAGAIYLYDVTVGEGDNAKLIRTAVTLDGPPNADGKQTAHRVADEKPVTDADGKPLLLLVSDLTAADTSQNVKTAMKSVLDLAALADPKAVVPAAVIIKLGRTQDATLLPVFQKRLAAEKSASVQSALHEAIAVAQLKSEDPATQASAARDLGQMEAIECRDFVEQLQKDSAPGSAPYTAATSALARIDGHLKVVNGLGTIFRGLSLGSVLLVMAVGLAITFGLMGVINMAHGELIAVGAYTTYVVQNIFGTGLALSPFGHRINLPGMSLTGGGYESYFAFALPISFLTSALVGILLERCVIQFLYRRPLESLLATWGVSLVLQQLLRSIFGASNVQVSSPAWLSGNWTVYDVVFGWNRVFVIAFAVAILGGTMLLLTRTPIGLLIRAVTQNRAMAACMGVRTERVNMLTFGFGSGLAGLAGAFYSQLGNVGPSMGQDHIVNAFMTVVVGGLGSLIGTVVAALGIGVSDQTLQSALDPVLGKIIVLTSIILFFMWRPAGLFVTKSRNLES